MWFFGILTFVPVGWSCKKQTAVFHSSTEAEVISLDAGLRQDGIVASGLWDTVIFVLEPRALGNLMRHPTKKLHMSKNSGVKQLIGDLDLFFPNAHTSSQRASLFIFEDNAALIKMTFKGLSPTMRHVSQTHRVDLGWLSATETPWILESQKSTLTPINRLLTS